VCAFCGSAAIERISLSEPSSDNGFLWVATIAIAVVMFVAGYAVRSFREPSLPATIPASSFAPVYRPAEQRPVREYITGPRGGCYYINRNGNKTYVDRSMCR